MTWSVPVIAATGAKRTNGQPGGFAAPHGQPFKRNSGDDPLPYLRPIAKVYAHDSTRIAS